VCEYYVGQILPWSVPWIPQGFLPCDGRELQVGSYAPLFAVIGSAFGGDGTATFKLPKLLGRVPQGANPSNGSPIGSSGDAASAAITAAGAGLLSLSLDNLPAHSHGASYSPSPSMAQLSIPATQSPSQTQFSPDTNCYLSGPIANTSNRTPIFSPDEANTSLKPFSVAVPSVDGSVSVDSSGGGGKAAITGLQLTGSLSTLQSSLSLNFIICYMGIFPPHQ
jgi:Microcystin-dependent protein